MHGEKTNGSSLLRRVLALFAVMSSLIFWLLWIPLHIEAALPLHTQQWLARGDTSALLVLFTVWPIGLAALGCIAAVTAAILLRPFVSRSQAEGFIRALPFGGHLGKIDRAFLGIFKEHVD